MCRTPNLNLRQYIECNNLNHLNGMIDIGKMADRVLLMVDGSLSFRFWDGMYHY